MRVKYWVTAFKIVTNKVIIEESISFECFSDEFHWCYDQFYWLNWTITFIFRLSIEVSVPGFMLIIFVFLVMFNSAWTPAYLLTRLLLATNAIQRKAAKPWRRQKWNWLGLLRFLRFPFCWTIWLLFLRSILQLVLMHGRKGF